MSRWWGKARGTPDNRFRPRLEGFEDRWVPDGNPVGDVGQTTTGAAAAKATVAIDFTFAPVNPGQALAADTYTITVTDGAGVDHVVRVEVGAGSSPGAAAIAAAGALRSAGYAGATATGSIVSFEVDDQDLCCVTVTHLDTVNNNASVTIGRP